MGLRNPSRLSIDPETDVPYSAWVGPDAGAPSATQGPSTYENAAQLAAGGQLRLALLHGQPAGLPRPHRRRLAADHQRGGLRQRRSRRRADPGLVRLRQPRQRLDEQHRPDRAPARDRTGKDAGTARSDQPLVQPRQPRRRQRLPGLPARAGRERRARTTAATRRSSARTSPPRARRSSTARSIATSPAADNSAAGPSTGTAAGSCTTSATTAPSTRCCSTRRPTRTAASRSTRTASAASCNWQANYMDSKFGPDGALYVQVYEGFFTTGPGAGLYRFTYTGGAGHPGPRPAVGDDRHRAADPVLDRRLRRRLLRVGLRRRHGRPTEADPMHTYAAAGTLRRHADGHLRRRRDGSQDGHGQRRRRHRGADDDRPAQRRDPGPTYDAGRGHAQRHRRRRRHRRRVDRVPHRRRRLDPRDNTDYADPFVTTFSHGDGDHTVEFRSRDRAGNVEDPHARSRSRSTRPGGGGLPAAVRRVRRHRARRQVDRLCARPAAAPWSPTAALTLPILQGDFIANDPLASNTLLQDAPSGEWTVTAGSTRARSTPTASRPAS